MLASVPGALVSAPFSMVLFAVFTTQVGALQSAPILVSVVTAYLTYLVAKRNYAGGHGTTTSTS